MTFTPVTTHIADALNRLLQQYRDKPNITGILTGLLAEMQPLEQMFCDLGNNRWLATASGVQLDELGVLLGIGRTGQSDNDYRKLLQARIYQTISEGLPETIIEVYKFLTEANVVCYQEYYPAGIGLESDGTIPAGSEVSFYQFVQLAVPAGVRVESLTTFDPDDSFAFDGGIGAAIVGADGFASDTTESDGGKFAKTAVNNVPFAFAGGVSGDLGFGDVKDPALGGTFQ